MISAEDIIIIFDADIDKITKYVKTLKNKRIDEILIGLYDNNTIRIEFENEDINEIIFNNYKYNDIINSIYYINKDGTNKLEELSEIIPIDPINQKIINIIESNEQNKRNTKFPVLTDEELKLLAKYAFKNSSDNIIKKFINHYNIQILDEHIRYYTDNPKWKEALLIMMLESGAKPDSIAVMNILKPHMRNTIRSKSTFALLTKTFNYT